MNYNPPTDVDISVGYNSDIDAPSVIQNAENQIIGRTVALPLMYQRLTVLGSYATFSFDTTATNFLLSFGFSGMTLKEILAEVIRGDNLTNRIRWPFISGQESVVVSNVRRTHPGGAAQTLILYDSTYSQSATWGS